MINDRKYLNSDEIKSLVAVAKSKSLRDYLLIIISYHHGLRVSEVVNLQWSDFDLSDPRNPTIYIKRSKNGISGNHNNLSSDELKGLRRLKKIARSPWMFESRYGGRLAIRSVHDIIKKYGIMIGLSELHHHCLRHTCGYELAKRGTPPQNIKEYLGHKNINSTMIYINDAGRDYSKFNDCFSV